MAESAHSQQSKRHLLASEHLDVASLVAPAEPLSANRTSGRPRFARSRWWVVDPAALPPFQHTLSNASPPYLSGKSNTGSGIASQGTRTTPPGISENSSRFPRTLGFPRAFLCVPTRWTPRVCLRPFGLGHHARNPVALGVPCLVGTVPCRHCASSARAETHCRRFSNRLERTRVQDAKEERLGTVDRVHRGCRTTR